MPLSAIRAAGPLPDDALARSVRVAGSGGFFGYYGRFGAVLLATYAWTSRAAVVADGEIRIERRLAAPIVIPLAEVRRVERLHPRYARGFWRVPGTALPSGVAFGKFRSRELGDFRLYAWRRGPYVLADTADERIVLTPDDPDAFVAAVGAAIHR